MFESISPEKFHDYIIQINKVVGEQGLVDVNKIKSTVSSSEYYDTVSLKISSIVRSLIKNHAFVDGNKRTALAFFILMCRIGDIPVIHDKDRLLEIIVDIAKNSYSVEQIEKILFHD
jgi:death-on-curing protein